MALTPEQIAQLIASGQMATIMPFDPNAGDSRNFNVDALSPTAPVPGMATQGIRYVDPKTGEIVNTSVQYDPSIGSAGLARMLYNQYGGGISQGTDNQIWYGDPAQGFGSWAMTPQGTIAMNANGTPMTWAQYDAMGYGGEDPGMGYTKFNTGPTGGWGPDGSWYPQWPDEKSWLHNFMVNAGPVLPVALFGGALAAGPATGTLGGTAATGAGTAGAGTAAGAGGIAAAATPTVEGLAAFYGTGGLTGAELAAGMGGFSAAELAALGVTPETMAVGTNFLPGAVGAAAGGNTVSNLLGGGQNATSSWLNPGLASLIGTGIGGLGAYFGAGELSDAYGQAMNQMGQYATQATGALQDYSQQGIDAIQAGLTGARGDILQGINLGGGYLTSSLDNALAQLQAGQGSAIDALQNYSNLGVGAIEQALGQARGDITQYTGMGAGAISDAQAQATAAIQNAISQGAGSLEQYRGMAGTDLQNYINLGVGAIGGAQDTARADLEAALARANMQLESGYGAGIGSLQDYMGQAQGTLQDWQTQALQYMQPYADIGQQGLEAMAADAFGGTGSPLYAWQAEQAAKAINAQAAARGSWNSGATMAQLADTYTQLGALEAQRKSLIQQELAKMGFDASSLSMQSGQQTAQILAELQARTGMSIAELQAALGQSQANLTAGTGQDLANISMQGGQTLANLYGTGGTTMANIDAMTGANLANLYGQGGANLANVATTTGSSLANLYGTAGGNLANVAMSGGNSLSNLYGQTGSALANTYMQGGMAGADLYGNYGNAMANLYGTGYNNLANMGMSGASQIGNMLYGTGQGTADILTGTGANMANLLVGQGGANQAQLTGPANALLSGLNSYMTYQGLASNPGLYTAYHGLLNLA